MRLANEADIPFLMDVYNHAANCSEVFALRDEALWKLEISGRSPSSVSYPNWVIIENAETHEPLGYWMWYPNWTSHDTLYVIRYDLKPGVSWLEVNPSVLRHIWSVCQAPVGDGKIRSGYGFLLGQNHPVYTLMGNDLPQLRKPYAWYVRVHDLPAFLCHIAPALEARLEKSIAIGYGGEIKFNFYRNGMRLVFENGKLLTAEAWQPTPEDWGHVGFPDLTFLQILFGYRSYQELRQSFADCWCETETYRALVEILFPKKLSNVLGIV
jgi:hypothetical protein